MDETEMVRRSFAMRAAAMWAALASMTSAGAAAADTVTVAYFQGWPTANQIAQSEKAYDRELGVEVAWRPMRNSAEMSQALASGAIDIAIGQGVAAFLDAVSTGVDLKMVGVAVSYGDADGCVLRGESGIVPEDAASWDEAAIATPVGGLTHYRLLRTLNALEVDLDAVTLRPMAGSDAAAALERGEVEAACAFGGPLARMSELGAPLLSAEAAHEMGLRAFDVITTTSAFAINNPELLTAFMKVTDDAVRAYAAEPSAYTDMIARAAGIDLATTTDLLALFAFPTADAQAGPDWMAGAVPEFLKGFADFRVAEGLMERALDDYGPVVDPNFLP